MGNLTNGQFVEAADFNPITFDTGDLKWSARRSAADGWLSCDGSAVSRTTYADLFAAIVPLIGTFTVTIASPAVFTLPGHGLKIGDRVFPTTTGALPTGLTAESTYYVAATPTTDTFTLASTRGGSALNTSGSQSGTHSLYACPYGQGDGSTTFDLPTAGVQGTVAADGSIKSGQGFSVSKTGTGIYAVTFNPELGVDIPALSAVTEGSGTAPSNIQYSSLTISGVTFELFTPSAGATDGEFSFTVNGGRGAYLYIKT